MIKKKILVIDDEPLISILMKEVIEEDPEFEVAQMASSKNEFLGMMEKGPFDAAIVDISIGGREGGIELLKIIKDRTVNVPVVMLSAHDELYYALRCLQAGAKGYVNKRYICSDVVKSLKEVLDGRLFVSGDRGQHVLEQYKKLNTPAAAGSVN